MGIFDNKNKKLAKELATKMVQSKKSGTFTCWCGRSQAITYFGSNDTWTCPKCGRKNRCI